MNHIVALFGESEKGQFKKPYILQELPQLIDLLGNPPQDSEGLFFAIQALLYQREIIYFRVQEEGYSQCDYLSGFKYLETVKRLDALCLPGVGDADILAAIQPICDIHKSMIISTQKDLFDYLTNA
ncbi:MAG TPA: hypothetical protein VLE95_00205 [Chlamydiales bacterium]|nr:hypothetical protein [Chlamydiales bacterium]